MKIFSIILLAVFIVSQSEGVSFDEELKKLLESLREDLKNGNPPLDPFELKNTQGPINISFTEDLIGTFDADSLVISNYSDYTVKHAVFILSKGFYMEASFSWDDLIYGKVHDYDINCRLMDFVNIIGKGDATFTIQGFKFDVKTNGILNNDKKLVLENLNIEFTLGGFKIDIKGLYDNEMVSEVISQVISDMAVDKIKEHYSNLKPAVEKFITFLGNEYLRNKTLSDIWNIITGGKSVNAFLH